MKEIWEESPEKGILPKGVKTKMWRNIYRKTLMNRPLFVYGTASVVLVLILLGSNAIYTSSIISFKKRKMLTVKTNSEDIRLLKLPDGSRIWLNEDSEIVYPEKFKGNERVVQLRGEAFFDITRDTTRPFKIKYGEFTTTVLGTSFNIKAYDNSSPKVSVVSGKVQVEKKIEIENSNFKEEHIAGYKKVELIKGEATVYKGEHQTFKKLAFKNQEEIAWKKSLLDISNKNLKEVINQLEKCYHVNFVYQDNIDDYILKGTLDIRQSIGSSLKIISFAIGAIEFEQKNDSIWIVKKKK